MRVLVTGGRDYRDRSRLFDELYSIAYQNSANGMVVMHGMASGADALTSEWAGEAGVKVLYFPADWKAHGRAAGPIRNQRMLDEGKPDMVLAFPGGRGTTDMVRRARAAGVPVVEVEG